MQRVPDLLLAVNYLSKAINVRFLFIILRQNPNTEISRLIQLLLNGRGLKLPNVLVYLTLLFALHTEYTANY